MYKSWKLIRDKEKKEGEELKKKIDGTFAKYIPKD